jgi:hypothetical protein
VVPLGIPRAWRAHVHHLAGAAVAFAIALAGLAVSDAYDVSEPGAPGRMRAGGALSLTDSRDGAAILSAQNMAPGDQVTGSVQIGADGTDAAFELVRTALVDTAGPGGARLSAALALRIDDVSAATPWLVFEGPLDHLARLALGTLRASEARTYRFTVTLPDRGLFAAGHPDNALQAAAVRVDYAWRATPLDSIAPPPSAVPEPAASGPVSAPPGPAAPGDAGAAGSDPGLTLRIARRRVLGRRRIVALTSCRLACDLRVAGAVVRSGRARAARVLLRDPRVFRGSSRRRVHVAAGAARRVSLRLSRRAVRVLERELNRRGRVTVRVTARTDQDKFGRRVRRRITLRTVRRADGRTVERLSIR